LKGRLADGLELVLVNDCSTDGSPAVAERLAKEFPEVKLVRHDVNRGIGRSLKTGYSNATGDWISIVPADGQFNPVDLLSCAGMTENADIVCICRKGRGDVTFYRRFISGANRLLNRVLFGLNVRDVNWVKLYRAWTIHDITVKSASPFVESERLALAVKAGAVIAQLDAPHAARTTGKEKGARFGTVVRSVADLISFAVRFRRRV
jgi:glycosyltransferase involved in cell wall biosynthesis